MGVPCRAGLHRARNHRARAGLHPTRATSPSHQKERPDQYEQKSTEMSGLRIKSRGRE